VRKARPAPERSEVTGRIGLKRVQAMFRGTSQPKTAKNLPDSSFEIADRDTNENNRLQVDLDGNKGMIGFIHGGCRERRKLSS